MKEDESDNGELTLATGPKVVPGPPVRGGKPRKNRYSRRPNRKGAPRELIRTEKKHFRYTPAYAEYLDARAASLGVDVQVMYDLAMRHLAGALSWESPPPLDPKKVPEGPWLEGLEPAKR